MKLWSRNTKYDLYATGWLSDYDRSGERLAVTKMNPITNPSEMSGDGNGTTLFIVDNGKPPRAILTRKDLILGPSWSPDGKRIVVGVGVFSAFSSIPISGTKSQ